jgi:hypothetical protein
MERIVVIGADAAGMSAAHPLATRLKQLPAILGRFNVMVTTGNEPGSQRGPIGLAGLSDALAGIDASDR